jgi:two-component system sensor histidine kinase UhpB
MSGVSGVKQGDLYRRVFLLNAAIFVAGTLLVLALVVVTTSATVTLGLSLVEAMVLVLGLVAILVLNAVALRAVFAPLERLMRLMRAVDPHRPGERLQTTGPREVTELVSVFNEMLDRLEDERRESVGRALAAQEGERHRIAQELHDDVGQVLTSVLLRLESVARDAPEDLLPGIRATQEATREAIERVSLVVRELRPEALTELGLAKAIAALTRRVSDESGLRVRHRLAPGIDDLGEECELVIYRVAQESLTNVARHAHAKEVEVTVERLPDAVKLRVRDDGVGMKNAHPARHGILGMRERALLIGAELTIRTPETGGVEVVLTAPFER